MASKFYPNQAGTTNSTFDIGLGKLRLDASNLTTTRTLKFPDSNGTTGQLLETDGSGNLAWTTVTISDVTGLRSELDTKSYNSTGLITGGAVSINVDNTKFNVAAGTAIFMDYTVPLAPVATTVSFGPFTGVTPTSLNTALVTYVGINSSGTLVQQTSPFTNTQRRTIVSLGSVVHSNLTNINTTNYICSSARTDVNQFGDMMSAIGPLNIGGNEFSANGANLNINKSSGTLFKFGSNFPNNDADPHTLALSGATAATFRYRTATGAEGTDVTSIDPNTYESPAGTVIAVPNNKFTVQRIALFSSGAIRIQRGQAAYDSMFDAQASFATETFQTETNIAENGIIRCLLIVQEGATNLTDPETARFMQAGKFGAVASGGTNLTLSSITAALGYTPADDALVVHKAGDTMTGTLNLAANGLVVGTNQLVASSGNILVGRTTSTLNDTNGMIFNPAGVISAENVNSHVMALNRSGTDGEAVQFYKGAATQVGSISVTTTATAYNTTSDYRLKNIDGPLTGSGEFIDSLKPYEGTWKATGEKFVGFVAHEVQEVSPTSVTGAKDAVEEYEVVLIPEFPAIYDDAGNVISPRKPALTETRTKPDYQTMEYGSAEFITNIIAELQSLRKRVAELEALV